MPPTFHTTHPLWAFMDQPSFFPFSSPQAAREQANTNTNTNTNNNGDEPPSGPEGPTARGGGGRRHHHHGPGRGRHGHNNRRGPWQFGGPFARPPPAVELFQQLASQVLPGADARVVEQLWNHYQRAWTSHEKQVDFTPRTDVFATPERFIVHVSLPGAKKEDVNVNYNPGRSTLQVSGVVLRPGIDEEMHSALVQDERGGEEMGVFEREVELGEKVRGEPANVDAEGVSARLADGVLVVVLPRFVTEKKKVVVEDGNVTEDASASAPGDSVQAAAEAPDAATAVPSPAPSANPPADSATVDTETEKGDAESTQHSQRNLTPDDSEDSDWEDGGKEFVKVNVAAE